MERDENGRPMQTCPVCGIRIYMNRNFNYECYTHGEFKLSYVTGELEEANMPKDKGKKNKGGCCDKCKDKGKCKPKKDKK